MRLKLVFMCTLFLGDIYLVNTYQLSGLNDTTPEDFPFHAVVHADTVCGGVLITENYVITPAYCVYRSSSAKVYLGFREYPYYILSGIEANTQTLRSSAIYVHEDFAELKDHHYLNNIALIQLSSPAVLSNNNVHPGKLMAREDTHFLEGRYANISGWFALKDAKMKLSTVQIRNKDTCSYLFEDGFLKSQELCVKWLTKSHLSLLGNPVSVDSKIIGFQTNSPSCLVPSSSCGRNNLVLSFMPFLEWMSHKMDIPIAQFTVTSQETRHKQDLAKIKGVIHKINETINKEMIDLRRYKRDTTNQLNEQTKNIIAQLESSKLGGTALSLSLNEQIGSIRTQISRRETRVDQRFIGLQENLSSVRTEVSGGLIAQRNLNGSQATFMEKTEGLQQSVNDRLDSLDKVTREIANRTTNNQIEGRQRHLQQQQEIKNLTTKLNDVNIAEAKNQLELHALFGNVNNALKNVSGAQGDLQVEVEALKELKAHISRQKESLTKLQEKLDDVINTGNQDKVARHLQFDEIDKIFGEFRIDFNKHIIQELSQNQLLWGEVKSLNSSVNEMTKYFFWIY